MSHRRKRSISAAAMRVRKKTGDQQRSSFGRLYSSVKGDQLTNQHLATF